MGSRGSSKEKSWKQGKLNQCVRCLKISSSAFKTSDYSYTSELLLWCTKPSSMSDHHLTCSAKSRHCPLASWTVVRITARMSSSHLCFGLNSTCMSCSYSTCKHYSCNASMCYSCSACMYYSCKRCMHYGCSTCMYFI